MLGILTGHLFGDIVLQNRWLAGIKMRSIFGMLLHCLIVTLVMAVFTGWVDFRALLVFISHFVIDWFLLGKKWPIWFGQGKPGSDEPPPMWLGLLDDQTFHLVAYWGISLL